MTTPEADTRDPALPPPLAIAALDDDEDYLQYVQSTLEQDGHDVRTFSDPDAFFKGCEERIPELVLLDIKMGRHSGEQVLTDLRTRWPRLAVVVVTGYPSLDSMRQTFKQDVFDYLAKPFSLGELRRTLQQAAAALNLGQRPEDRLRGELGHQIRLARTDKGWTLKDLSEVCGVSVSQLSSIERGTHLPSLESLVTIALALEQQPSKWLAASGL